MEDPDTARIKMNKEMGGIRVGQRSKKALDAVSASLAVYSLQNLSSVGNDDTSGHMGTLSHLEACGNAIGKNNKRFCFPPNLAQLERKKT